MRRRLVAAVLVLVWAAAVERLDAQAAEDPGGDTTLSPYFLVSGDDDDGVDRFTLLGTAVQVQVAGVIADVRVTQTYENDGTRPINASYVFPASTRAAVHGLSLSFGGEVVRAQIKEREQARQEFERAQSEHKTATLLEQDRPNVFRMSISNVMPRDRIEVELHYSELLVPEDGTYEFVYPTVVGPRYSTQAAAGAAPAERWIASPCITEGTPPGYTLQLGAHIVAGTPIDGLTSPSHAIDVRWVDRAEVGIALDPSESIGGNRDFVLRYRLDGGTVQAGLLLLEGAEVGRDESFFLLTVQPPRRVSEAEIPAREYVFVVDVSGSMDGFPLETSKRLLRSLIGNLRPTDTFNVLFFAGGSRLLSPASLAASPANVELAAAMIDGQRGGGGTELLAAMRRALALPATEGVSRSVIVVTDGYISAEREVFTHIRESLDGANVFCFGIGTSVNRYLVEGIARAGLGEPFVVLDPAEAPEVADRLRDYVLAPVLTDVSVAFEGFDAYDVEPSSFPDVLADRPLLIHGKWRGAPQGRIVVRGQSGTGDYEQRFEVTDVAPSPANEALAYLWAKSRVSNLSDFAFGRVTEEEKGELVRLGLKYDLLTRYTSFIAVRERVRPAAELPADVEQPLPLPQGVSALAIGQGPEPPLWVLAAALVLSFAAWRLLAGGARP
jgi:Ca-activated chloride channel family protein